MKAGVGVRDVTALRRRERRRRQQHKMMQATRPMTKSGTAMPITIFAHSGRPELPSPRALPRAVGEAAAVLDVLAADDATVVGDVFDAVDVGPNSPLKYCCTSVGSAVNQAGVLPSRNSDHSSRETAGTLVRARARMDGGTAVARSGKREALGIVQLWL